MSDDDQPDLFHGLSLYENGRYEEAIQELWALARQGCYSDVELYWTLGDAYFKKPKPDYAQAISWFHVALVQTDAMLQDSIARDIYQDLLTSYQAANRHDEAAFCQTIIESLDDYYDTRTWKMREELALRGRRLNSSAPKSQSAPVVPLP